MPAAVCGDGQKDASESCDGSDLGGATCASLLGASYAGSLSCNQCAYDSTGCFLVVARSGCNSLAVNCGATVSDDCCATDTVPGGTFPMGRSGGTDAFSGGKSDEQPEHDVEVASFGLDRYEVTVGRFRKWVDTYDGAALGDGAGAHPLIPGSGWQLAWNQYLPKDRANFKSALGCSTTYQTWTDSAGANEAKPINCVSWYEAFAFCMWDGGRLPTEAEWEYAAAAGSENRRYPWGGQTPGNTRASFDCLFSDTSSCEAADLPAVGSTPAGKGKWGHQDLAGSVYEWNLDWYDPSWYNKYIQSGSCKNCANVQSGSPRVIRGGDFHSVAAYMRAAGRSNDTPASRGYDVGLRCARTPLCETMK
jgi:formylglycine-generating enzyme required for sulfatase activity